MVGVLAAGALPAAKDGGPAGPPPLPKDTPVFGIGTGRKPFAADNNMDMRYHCQHAYAACKLICTASYFVRSSSWHALKCVAQGVTDKHHKCRQRRNKKRGLRLRLMLMLMLGLMLRVTLWLMLMLIALWRRCLSLRTRLRVAL